MANLVLKKLWTVTDEELDAATQQVTKGQKKQSRLIKKKKTEIKKTAQGRKSKKEATLEDGKASETPVEKEEESGGSSVESG